MHVIAKCFLHFYSAYPRFYRSISVNQSLKVFKSYKCMQSVEEEDVFLLIFISIYLIIDTNSNSTTMLPKKSSIAAIYTFLFKSKVSAEHHW